MEEEINKTVEQEINRLFLEAQKSLEVNDFSSVIPLIKFAA